MTLTKDIYVIVLAFVRYRSVLNLLLEMFSQLIMLIPAMVLLFLFAGSAVSFVLIT